VLTTCDTVFSIHKSLSMPNCIGGEGSDRMLSKGTKSWGSQ